MLYLTGDTHGENIERFSFKKNPSLRELTADDIVVVLGDTALMWPGAERITRYDMRQLRSKPFTIIFLFGNHDNYDWAETLPEVDVFGGKMRQVVIDGEVFENRYVVSDWTVADLSGYHCLLCGHAKSHDIDHLYDENDKEGILAAKRRREWFRVAHKSWWPQETLDIDDAVIYVQEHEDEHFDAILTHDCPGYFCHIASPHGGSTFRFAPTRQEDYFDSWREDLDYDIWVHGHMHYEFFRYMDMRTQDNKQHFCIYHDFFSAETLKNLTDEDFI